jgi:HEAT repeat protein
MDICVEYHDLSRKNPSRHCPQKVCIKMSESFSVCCPHCQASGELSDFTLMGKPIQCPVCQQVFVAPAPPVSAEPAIPAAFVPVAADPASQMPYASAPVPVPGPAIQPYATPPATLPTTSGFPAQTSDFPQFGDFSETPDQSFSQGVTGQTSSGSSHPKRPARSFSTFLIWNAVSLVIVVGVFYYLNSKPSKRSGRKGSEELTFNFKVPNQVSTAGGDPSRFETQPAGTPAPVNSPAPEMPAKAVEKAFEVPANQKFEIGNPAPAPAPKPVMPEVKPAPAVPAEVAQTMENMPREIQLKLEDADDDKSLALLIELLAYPHAGVREKAAYEIRDLTAAAPAVPPLLKLLSDPSPSVRTQAIQALAKHGVTSPDVIPALGKILREDPDRSATYYLTSALTDLGKGDMERSRAVAEQLLPHLSKFAPDEMHAVIRCLSELGEATRPGIPTLTQMLGKESYDSQLVDLLAQYGQLEVLEAFIKQKPQDKNELNQRLAHGIGRLRPMSPEALAIIKLLAADPNEDVREAAMKALHDCEPKLPEAIPILELAQSDPQPDVRALAAEALGVYDLDPARKATGLLKQLLTAKPATSEYYDIVGAIFRSDSVGFHAVIDLIGNPETKPEIRDLGAVLVAERWNDKEYDRSKADTLRKILNNPEQPLGVRTACSVVLSRMNQSAPRLNATLLEAISSNSLDPRIRISAAGVVPRGSAEFISALLAATEWCEAPLPATVSPEAREIHQRLHAALLDSLWRSGRSEPAKVLPRLIAGARQTAPVVKIQALYGLNFLERGSPEAVEVVRELLKHENAEVRQRAAGALGGMHEIAAAAIPDLREALKDKEHGVRREVAGVLEKFGPAAAAAVPDLLAILADEKDGSMNAARALAQIAPRDAAVLATLIKALDRADVRDDVVMALGEIGPEARGAIPALLKVLPDSEKFTRWSILLAFRAMGEDAKEAIPDIVRSLSDPAGDVRGAAAATLGRMHDHAAAAVPDLLKLVSDSEESVADQAITALGQIGAGAKSSKPVLEEIVAKGTSARLQARAREALERLQAAPGNADPKLFYLLLDAGRDEPQKLLTQQGDGGLKSFIAMAVHENETVSMRAWSAVSKYLEEPAGQELIRNWLNGNDASQRGLAAIALKQLPAQGDPTELARALTPWLRNRASAHTAEELLLRIGRPAAPALAEAMTDQTLSAELRSRVRDSYNLRREIEAKQLLPLLRRDIKSENVTRRQAAALALAAFNPREPETLPLLLECLSGADMVMRDNAIRAILELHQAEVDVKLAVPSLMKIFTETQAELKTRPEQSRAVLYDSSRALAEIGPRPEDLAPLQDLLHRNIVELEMLDKKKPDSWNGIVSNIAQIIDILSSYGPQAEAVIPDVKLLLDLEIPENQYADPITDRWYNLSRFGQPMLQTLQEVALKSDSPPVARRRAVQILNHLVEYDPAVIGTLTELLKDMDVEIQRRAALALIGLPRSSDPKIFETALAVLRTALLAMADPKDQRDRDDSGTDPRYAIVQQLLIAKEHALPAVPELLQVLKQDSTVVLLKMNIVRALLYIAPKSADVRQAIVECLKIVPDDQIEMISEAGLEKLGPDFVTELVQAVEKEPDPWRIKAIQLLGGLKAKALPAVPALRAIMTADQSEVGLVAALSLARIDPTAKDTITRIVAALPPQSKYQFATLAAIRSLGPNAAEALPKLISLSKDERWGDSGFQMLGALGAAAKPALPQLLEAVLQSDSRYSAQQALLELGPNAAELAPQLIAHMRSNRDSPGAAIVAKMGEPAVEAVKQLREDLQDESRQLRTIALLGQFGPLAAPAVPELLPLANSDDSELRLAVFRTLAEIGPDAKDAVQVLAASVSDPDPTLAVAAVHALSTMKDKSLPVLPQIIAALEKPRERTQGELIEILANLGPAAAQAVPVLSKLPTQNNAYLQRKVRIAIETIQANPDSKAK